MCGPFSMIFRFLFLCFLIKKKLPNSIMLRAGIGKHNWLNRGSAQVRYEFLVIDGKTHGSGFITKQEAFSV